MNQGVEGLVHIFGWPIEIHSVMNSIHLPEFNNLSQLSVYLVAHDGDNIQTRDQIFLLYQSFHLCI